MKALGKRDVGKMFVAPSGRRVEFIVKSGDAFFFAYEDDPADGLALSLEGLRILEREGDTASKTAPMRLEVV